MQPQLAGAARRPLLYGSGAPHRRRGCCCALGALLVLCAGFAGAAPDVGPGASSRGKSARSTPQASVQRALPGRPGSNAKGTGEGAGRLPRAAPDARPAAVRERRGAEVPALALARPAPRTEPEGAERGSSVSLALEPLQLPGRREAFGFPMHMGAGAGVPHERFGDAREGEPRAWTPARSRWGLEKSGHLSLQFESGYRLSVRPRHGGLAVSLKRNF